MTCEYHKKNLLRFLMVKTAAVRAGVKPGALLRVQRCYHVSGATQKETICLHQQEILAELKLDFKILKKGPESALVLFYAPHPLAETLRAGPNRVYLKQYSYPETGGISLYLDALERRCGAMAFPHEVGLFIGYPLKDVAGFMEKAPRTPVDRGDWQVFGDPRESLRLMHLYRCAERLAEKIIESCQDMETCLDKIANINLPQTARS